MHSAPKLILLFFAFLPLVSFAADNCLDSTGEHWLLECERELEYIKFMEDLEAVTFTKYERNINNCSSGALVQETYTIDHTSDVLWDIRRQFYDNYFEKMYECTFLSNYADLNSFQTCLLTQRLLMIRNINTGIVDKIEDHLNDVEEEENTKCDELNLRT